MIVCKKELLKRKGGGIVALVWKFSSNITMHVVNNKIYRLIKILA